MTRAGDIHQRSEQAADAVTGYVVGANNALIQLAPDVDYPPEPLPGPGPQTHDWSANVAALGRYSANGTDPYPAPIPVVPYEPTMPLVRPSRDPDAAWMAPTVSVFVNTDVAAYGPAAYAGPAPAGDAVEVYPHPQRRDRARVAVPRKPPTWAELIRRRLRRERRRIATR